MKAHLLAIALWGLTAGAARHHDIAAIEARQIIPADAAVSVCYTYTSTYLTTIGPSSTVSSTSALPTPSVAFIPVILGIEVLGVAKRDLEKRAGLGGFVTDDPANPNANNCSGATVFQLQVGGGVFLNRGLPLFTTAGASFGEFRSLGAPPANAITTLFSGTNGDVLSWTNTAFLNGAASFCQVPTTGQVYSSFQGIQNIPAGCVTVQLRIYASSRCINGNIDGNPSSSAAPIPTTQSVASTNAFSSSTQFESSSTVTPSPSSSSEVGPSPPLSSASSESTSSSLTDVLPSSSSLTDVLPSSSSLTDVLPSSSSLTDVFPSSSGIPDVFSSSTIIPDVFPSSTAVVPSSVTSSASLSSTTDIIITSTSTETTFVVASSTSSIASSTSAAFCPFTASGSLLVNGGFENAAADPFAYSSTNSALGKRNAQALKKKQTTSAHTINIVPASTAPRAFGDRLCNNILDISYPGGGTQPVTDAYTTILPFTLSGQTYSISFDILACGTDGAVQVEINDFLQNFDNQDCSAGTSAAWTTISGTFNALGLLDTIYIRVTGVTSVSENYFDNFIITSFNGAVGSPSSSTAPVPTPPAFRL